jgi:predicted DNA-binding protein (MmcQ/YjbR family)
MNIPELQHYCASLAGAVRTNYAEPSNILVYSVEGKTFAYFKTSEPERWRFSVRVTPERFLELTAQPGIKPARYRGRYHWVTVVAVAQFPADYLLELVRDSHRRVLLSLSARRRTELSDNPSKL